MYADGYIVYGEAVVGQNGMKLQGSFRQFRRFKPMLAGNGRTVRSLEITVKVNGDLRCREYAYR
jgi:hypothetical protein